MARLHVPSFGFSIVAPAGWKGSMSVDRHRRENGDYFPIADDKTHVLTFCSAASRSILCAPLVATYVIAMLSVLTSTRTVSSIRSNPAKLGTKVFQRPSQLAWRSLHRPVPWQHTYKHRQF
jgi:hypothetical protein